MSKVLVHTCYSIEAGDPKPTICACRKFVSSAVSKKLLAEGLAEYVLKYDRKVPYHSGTEVCLVNRKKSTPRAATIEKAHILRAYVAGDLEEQERINEYGRMAKDLRNGITKLYDDAEHRAAEKKYRGRDYSIVDGGDMLRPLEAKQ